MRETLPDLMIKLGVGEVPEAYYTAMWMHSDIEKGQTCTAEVRMGGEMEPEVECEIQLMHDVPPEGGKPQEQICSMLIRPDRENKWDVKSLKVREQTFEEIYDWQGKSVTFFSTVVQHLKREEMPDFDELIKEIFHDKERFSTTGRGGSGKSPGIDARQLVGMKQGM